MRVLCKVGEKKRFREDTTSTFTARKKSRLDHERPAEPPSSRIGRNHKYKGKPSINLPGGSA